jgi:hypothetical protein
MNKIQRLLVATGVVAAMSAGLVPQALAAPATHSAAARSAPPAGVVSAAATSDAKQAAGYLKQWRFDPKHPNHLFYAKASFGGPKSRNTNLWNIQERRYLQWESQTFGINLGWTDDASPATAARVSRWFFTRSDTTHAIKYGDKLALGNGGSPSYIRYAERTWGINLEWSSSPVYEWKILGGKKGTAVRAGDAVSIYNTKTKQPLIYFDRTVGGDIGWPNSETWGDQIYDYVMKFIKDHWKEGVVYLLAL